MEPVVMRLSQEQPALVHLAAVQSAKLQQKDVHQTEVIQSGVVMAPVLMRLTADQPRLVPTEVVITAVHLLCTTL
jgi:hypothetical protein